MRCLLTVEETRRLSVGTQADPVQVAEGGLLLLPYLHLVPVAPDEREVACGPLRVELRRRGSAGMSASARVVETELPLHGRCRVVVLTDHPADVAEGTEVWSRGS